MTDICCFFDGISPNEERYRWDLLQIFHLTIIGFLNNYGYDFQQTTQDQIIEVIQTPRKSRLLNNFKILIEKNKLDDNKDINKILTLIPN